MDIMQYWTSASLPADIFTYGKVTMKESLERMYKDEEKEHGVCVVRDGFCIVITSWRPVTSFATDMKDYVPLHELKVFAVEIDG